MQCHVDINEVRLVYCVALLIFWLGELSIDVIGVLKFPNVFLKFVYLFYFWLHWVYVAAHGLSLVAASTLRCGAWASHHGGLSCCRAQALGTWLQQLWLAGSRVQAQQLWYTGLVALQHVRSSQTRALTHVPCVGRWIFNHCTTREAPPTVILFLLTSPFISVSICFIYLCLLSVLGEYMLMCMISSSCIDPFIVI